MGKKLVPNQRLNGNTVGGSGSFKAWPGYIVLPDRQRRMEFAGGCQKVSILCERLKPLFTALYRAQAPFVLLLLSPLASLFSLRCAGSAPDAFCPKSVANRPPPCTQARAASRNTRLSPATFPHRTDDPTLIPAPLKRALKRCVPEEIHNTRGFMERERGNCHSANAAPIQSPPSHNEKRSNGDLSVFTRKAFKNKSTEKS